jgi:class 3 adenylate cyclase
VTGRPDTSYAWNGDVCLAYQVVGQGPLDVLYIQGYCSNVDLAWEGRYLSRFLRGLGSHGRLILTDRRGWGCSDRFSAHDVQDIDTYVDDVGVVLDAAGSSRAVIVASHESALLACLFAAAHPSRTSGLVLIDGYPTYSWTTETPWAPTPEQWKGMAAKIRGHWGSRVLVDETSPNQVDEPEVEWLVRYMRSSITPAGLAAEMERYVGTDICAVLPTIHVPSLVFVNTDGSWGDVPEAGRYLATHIVGARSVELSSSAGPSLDGLHWYSRAEPIIREIGAFVDRLRDEQSTFDRVLATVLFTDIVDSTAQAATLGDRRWREVREEHDAIVRAHLARFRGREVKTMGDGFLATFDGPARAVRCATAITSAMVPLGIEIRAGLHTGEVELDGDDVAGMAVVIGARVGALAGPSEVLVSQTVKDLVTGSGLTFEDAGEHELKGVPDSWRLYRVVA